MPAALVPLPLLTLAAVVVVANGIAWAAFRIDKAAASAGRRRISERSLLILTALGGLGALWAMVGHRRRHKTRKPRFVIAAVLAAAAQLAALMYLLAPAAWSILR
ncbi:MAG: DUF1294 domain-containing protein [Myxococcales bacterium]|nr:DUF1294 domain-containing protein [Myxococcales bacterium]